MVNVVPREVPWPWDLPRHNIHHDTSSAFSNNVPFFLPNALKIGFNTVNVCNSSY